MSKMNFFDKKLSFCARKIPNFSYEIFKRVRKQVKAAKLSNFHQKLIFYQKLQKKIKNLDPNFEWLNNYFYLIIFTNKNDFCNNLE
jgi:superfamily II DNA/RNA helicase